jgi:hypothetical protein
MEKGTKVNVKSINQNGVVMSRNDNRVSVMMEDGTAKVFDISDIEMFGKGGNAIKEINIKEGMGAGKKTWIISHPKVQEKGVYFQDEYSKDEAKKHWHENVFRLYKFEVGDCIEYIKNSQQIKNNGYYLHIENMNNYVASNSVNTPKINSLCLITFNSGGQDNLKAVDTINSMSLASEIAKLLDIDIEIARIIVSEQITHSKPFTMSMLNDIENKNIIIADRDKIVCTNLSIKYAKGGYLEYRGTITNDAIKNILQNDFPNANYQLDFNFLNGSRVYAQKDVLQKIRKQLINEYGIEPEIEDLDKFGLPYIYIPNQIIEKMAKGGNADVENNEMVLNNNKQIAHHTKELPNAIKGKKVPAWVVAKVNRSASDLSDATHYMDGQGESYAKGGSVELKWTNLSIGQRYEFLDSLGKMNEITPSSKEEYTKKAFRFLPKKIKEKFLQSKYADKYGLGGFLFGAAVGAGATYYILKNKKQSSSKSDKTKVAKNETKNIEEPKYKTLTAKEKDGVRLLVAITKDGFDYAIRFYSDYKNINDKKFVSLRKDYIANVSKLEKYIESKNPIFEKYDLPTKSVLDDEGIEYGFLDGSKSDWKGVKDAKFQALLKSAKLSYNTFQKYIKTKYKLKSFNDDDIMGRVAEIEIEKPEKMANGGGVSSRYNQWAKNIYENQSEEEARVGLMQFAREEGFDYSDVEKALQTYKYDTEENAWGELYYTKKAIRNMISIISNETFANGGGLNDIEQNLKVGNVVELSESGWDNENYHDFFDGVDNVKLVITDVYKSTLEHQGFDSGVGMALYSTKRLDNNEVVPFDLYDYELEYVSKGKKYADGGGVNMHSKFDLNEKGNFSAKINSKDYEIIYRDDVSKLYDLFENGKKIKSSKNVRDLMQFPKQYANGGGIDDFKMSYDEMTTYEKSNHIHYNPMNSRWQVTKNGENKEFWNQEQAEKYAGFEFDYEKDSRYSRKKYEALFGYSDGGVVTYETKYDLKGWRKSQKSWVVINKNPMSYEKAQEMLENARKSGLYDTLQIESNMLKKPNYATFSVNKRGGQYANGGGVDDLLEFTIPTWAMTSLINGDDSGLEDEDIEKVNDFVDRVVKKYGNANFMLGDKSEETEFYYRNDIDGNMGGDVTTLYLRPTKKYADGGEVRNFDRHKQMDSNTRSEILDIIDEIDDIDGFRSLNNYLYGLFDGYDYSQTDDFKSDMEKLKSVNLNLFNRIQNVYSGVDKYSFYKMAKGGKLDFVLEYDEHCVNKILQMVSKVKRIVDYYILTDRLVIVLRNELYTDDIDILNTRLKAMRDCLNVFEDEFEIGNKEGYKTLLLRFKNTNYENGGDVSNGKKFRITGTFWYVTNDSAGSEYRNIVGNLLSKKEFDYFLRNDLIEQGRFNIEVSYDFQIIPAIYEQMADDDIKREIEYEEGRQIIGYEILTNNSDGDFADSMPYDEDDEDYENDEDDDYAKGGRLTSNEDIIEAFLTSNREAKVGNLSTHYNEYDNQMLLRNYGTLIASRKGNNVHITSIKYSVTTTKITNMVNRMAKDKGLNVKYVEKFEDGGNTSSYCYEIGGL